VGGLVGFMHILNKILKCQVLRCILLEHKNLVRNFCHLIDIFTQRGLQVEEVASWSQPPYTAIFTVYLKALLLMIIYSYVWV